MSTETEDNNFEQSYIMIIIPSLLGALILSFGLFLLVPATQWINSPKIDRKILKIDKPIHIPPPKPPPKPLPKVEKIQEKSVQIPKLKQSPQNVIIKGLDLNLDIGIGVELGFQGEPTAFKTEIDVQQQIKELFTFKDLSSSPRYISVPKMTYPKELIRRGIKRGKIVLLIEINEKGFARVLKVISSTNPRLESEAIRLVGKAKFTIPIVNGKPTKVQGEWPLILQAPK